MEPQKKQSEEERQQDLDAVAENMSKVNPDVIQRQTEEAAQPEETAPAATEAPKPAKKALTDRQGRAFDPALHEVMPNGSPRINRDGYIAGKPGRPGKFKQAHESRQEPAPGDPAQASPQVQPDREATDRLHTAAFSSMMFINLGVGIFGEEWLPIKSGDIDERQDLTNKFDAWYKTMGVSDLPPGVALALGLVGYAAIRLYKPNTQTRMKFIMNGIKNTVGKFFGSIFGWFKKLFKGAKAHASHVNPRDHGDRKDNTGAPVSAPVPA